MTGKKKTQNASGWMTALALAAMSVPAAAQQPAAALAAQTPAADPYVVGQARPPVPDGAGIRDMTLEQAIDIALENNLDLKVARMNPQIQDYSLVQARAAFNPTVNASFRTNNSSSPNTDATQVVTSIKSKSQFYSTSFAQSLPFLGGSYQATFNSNRATDSRPTQIRNPNLSASTQFQYTQPLLANFRIDQNRNAVRVQQVQRQIVDIQLQERVENTRASVRTAYWALRQAIEQVEIQQRALGLSELLLQQNRTRVEIGTLAPIDLVQNEATVATNEQALLNARIQWQSAELAFKRLLVAGTEDPLYAQTINPIEQPPALEEVLVNIPEAVSTALDQRTDLMQARKGLESSQFNLDLRKNAIKPSLNVTSTFQLQGQGGDTYNFNRTTLERTLISSGGYTDALSALRGFDQPTWTIQANFQYPLGMRAQRAALAQEQIRYEQTLAQLKAQELAVSTDVTNAGLAVQNSYQQLLAARKSREAADRNAEAEQVRFENGMSNNYNVAFALNDLTSRRLAELRAIISYVNAIADYEKKQRAGGQ
jgi:HAE1 family hydrophobic/amphiphilic exporter-1